VLLFFAGLLLSVIVGLVVVGRQMKQENQQQLKVAQQEIALDRRRFLQRLDHELKNPLTAIRTGLAYVADAPTDEERRDALETVEAQALRLSRLTADLRKIADLETRPLEVTSVNLSELLADVIEIARERPETDDFTIHLFVPQAPWPLPNIQGDQDLLFLAFYNLLDNAIKYTPAGGTIEIRGRENGSFVTIEVADTGPGIPGEEIGQVWNELYRGRSARGIAGSGLGLPLVRAIVDRHQGEVELHSRAGQGTLVIVSVPV
jgi:two-component system OmpR family sensor kinase